MKTRAVLLLLVLALAALAGTTRAAAGTATPADTTTYQVWFERGGKLWLTKRVQPHTTAPARAAVQALLAGPNLAEADAGVDTHIPAGTTLVGVSIADGLATVDLSSQFGTGTDLRMRLAQVTRTLTQFASVDRVRIRVGGTALGTFSSASFAAQMPAILVWNPPIGSHLASKVRVTGSADVFEAALRIRVLNANGVAVGSVNTLASCGTGCRGGYTVAVSFHVATTQLGTIVVSDDDADGNGVPAHQVKIPVVLIAP